MPVNRTRARERSAGLVGALLVQLILLGLFLQPLMPPARPRQLARELMLLLRPAPQKAPALRTIDARPGPLLPLPSLPTPDVRQDSAPTAVPPSASALQGLGQSLFGCAPETYAGLSREERAHCPPPGEGLARGEPSDLIGPTRSHAKDAQRWQEALDERHWEPQCAGAESVVSCLVQQSIAEHKRAEAVHKDLDWQKTKALQPSKPVLPNRIGVYRENTKPPPDAR
jgi:hypothetical protein